LFFQLPHHPQAETGAVAPSINSGKRQFAGGEEGQSVMFQWQRSAQAHLKALCTGLPAPIAL
jgi:hypothetical protein